MASRAAAWRNALLGAVLPLLAACGAPAVSSDDATVPDGTTDTVCVDVRNPNDKIEGAYFKQMTGLTYHPEKKLTGDLWLPARRSGPFPAILHIHGGGWTGGHRNLRNARLWGENFACRGFAFFDIDYQLEYPGNPTGDASRLMGEVRDSKCALRWLKGEAPKHGIDASRVIVMGGSAGGHLTGMMGTTTNVPDFNAVCSSHPEQDYSVIGAIPVYGIFNLVTMQQLRIDMSSWGPKLFGIENPTEKDWYYWSPITYVTPQTPPFLMIQGKADMLVPWQQSVEMGAKLSAASVYNEVVLIDGAEHAFDAFFNSEQTKQAIEAANRFADKIAGVKP